MKHLSMKKVMVSLVIISLLITNFTFSEPVKAADNKYGMVVADRNGKYSFYDWNDDADNSGAIETSSSGSVMVPLKKLVSLIPVLKYKYDAGKNTVTVTNSSNGKRIVFTKGSKYFSYYSSTKAKAVKKTMPYKMYLSAVNSPVMVHISSLKYVLQTTGGFVFYTQAQMQTGGYDTSIYNGLILYNPYQAVSLIPKAATVNGISATVKVTIPEGYSASQIFQLLVNKGVCASTASLYDAMENYDFSYYPLVGKIEENENRCFKLEGYLYPDTYEFYRLMKPQDVIGKFLRNTEARITADDRSKAEEMGYSMDQILTVASIVEKETSDKEKMPAIASVIYNRLNTKMKLQFDSSIYYVERYIKPFISGDSNRYNSFYNTYKCQALPAGPICSPGSNAIKAALNPAATDYLYFYSDKQGEYHFSKEWVNSKALDNPDVSGVTDSVDNTDTNGTDTNGTDTNGTDTNGTDTNGTNTNGTNTTGTNTTGTN
jgi:conserved hypothetical protein, YceG family